jgi:hypothetical protein
MTPKAAFIAFPAKWSVRLPFAALGFDDLLGG